MVSIQTAKEGTVTENAKKYSSFKKGEKLKERENT